MQSAFIIHGLGGDSNENWFPWLAQELIHDGWHVTVPDMPESSEPRLSQWLQFFKQYEQFLSPSSVLIGHSLGGTFLLRFLEQYPEMVDTVVIVASPIRKMENDLDTRLSTFIDRNFLWDIIRSKSKKFILLYSDDDPYVPSLQGEELARYLRTDLHIISHGGHLNRGSGYVSFPALRTLI